MPGQSYNLRSYLLQCYKQLISPPTEIFIIFLLIHSSRNVLRNDLLFASLRTPADHVGSLAVTAAFMARRFNDRFSRDVSCVFFQTKTFCCLKRNILLFFFLKCLLDLPLVVLFLASHWHSFKSDTCICAGSLDVFKFLSNSLKLRLTCAS